MHELSIAAAVVETATRHADGRRVTAIDLRIGHLRQVVPDSLAFYFEHVARESVCDGAELRIELVPAWMSCTACDGVWELRAAAFRCPVCGTADVTIDSGEELEVESIEVEQREEACTA